MKKTFTLAALAILCATLFSCQKLETPIGPTVDMANGIVLPVSNVPMDSLVTLKLTYDLENRNYVFTTEDLVPTKIKFKAFNNSSTMSVFTMAPGQKKVVYPINVGPEQPRDSYRITRIAMKKENSSDDFTYTYGNITYKFAFDIPDNGATDNNEDAI